jgi:hypothetical protein
VLAASIIRAIALRINPEDSRRHIVSSPSALLRTSSPIWTTFSFLKHKIAFFNVMCRMNYKYALPTLLFNQRGIACKFWYTNHDSARVLLYQGLATFQDV